jgi:hypothetical protein
MIQVNSDTATYSYGFASPNGLFVVESSRDYDTPEEADEAMNASISIFLGSDAYTSSVDFDAKDTGILSPSINS